MSDFGGTGWAIGLPLFFAAAWLAITSFFGLLAEWFSLQDRFPNDDDAALLNLNMRSGWMGVGVAFNSCLTLTACRSGLRISVWRILGPFQRPFLVPWNQIKATQKSMLFVPMARLEFGTPNLGRLTINARDWQKLANYGGKHVAQNSEYQLASGQFARQLLLQWIVLTTVAASFFYFAARRGGPAEGPPLAVCIGFPAAFIGIGMLFRLFRDR